MEDVEEPEPKKSKASSPGIQDTHEPEEGTPETDETPEDVILFLIFTCVESWEKRELEIFKFKNSQLPSFREYLCYLCLFRIVPFQRSDRTCI